MKPILILHIVWMRKFKGIIGDKPNAGKFKFVLEGGEPAEAFNFLPTNGKYYGYAPVGTINITRLGASPGADFIDNVLVIWTATKPGGGRFIVGWYDGARVFAAQQLRPKTRKTRALLYNVVTPVSAACRILKYDERVFPIPHHKTGYPGHAGAFFPEDKSPRKWVDSIRRYVAAGKLKEIVPRKTKGGRWAIDPERRAQVEKVAIELVTARYDELGYTVESREPDNLGWDLEAQQGETTLYLEVKGLSGHEAIVEVTPNEYKAMTSHRSDYRLCIVTDALTRRQARLRIFAHDSNFKAWISDDRETIEIEERTAARISVRG